VGVFVGVTTNSYHLWAPEERSQGISLLLPRCLVHREPRLLFSTSMVPACLDTACSSSLVAIHLACESGIVNASSRWRAA
jgi:acyl transferase domain-containing protein